MKGSLAQRLWEYQKERFPLLAMLPMSLAFSFSAVAYSRLASGRSGFIPLGRYAVGAFTALSILFLLRVLDEHKDKEIDARYRKELPVPRGLVSLKELRLLGGGTVGLALLLNLILLPSLLPFLALAAIWISLMTYEFFAPEWLRQHLVLYLLSHMAVLPIIDIYTTSLDWRFAASRPAASLPLFLMVTLMNGIVVEIGRKIRAPEKEKEGVVTYSQAWGLKKATWIWMACILLTVGLGIWAGQATGLGLFRYLEILALAFFCVAMGFLFLAKPGPQRSKGIEAISGLWTLCMYLWLGLGPYVLG